MTFLRHEWNETTRFQVINATWALSDESKTKWIEQMDNPRNLQTFVDFESQSDTIYLAFERREDGFTFTAGKRIRLIEFNLSVAHF